MLSKGPIFAYSAYFVVPSRSRFNYEMLSAA